MVCKTAHSGLKYKNTPILQCSYRPVLGSTRVTAKSTRRSKSVSPRFTDTLQLSLVCLEFIMHLTQETNLFAGSG